MRNLILIAALSAGPAFAQPADTELWRLDCGTIHFSDMSMFSDSFDYAGQPGLLTDSCYLIRHGGDYLLWDAGLPKDRLGAKLDDAAPTSSTLAASLTDQLAQIGVAPGQIGRVGISHNHFDHVGQAADFPTATLLIGAADWDGLRADPPAFGVQPDLLRPWLDGGKVQPVSGDLDIFGDGSVTMLRMPGHTGGETALLVRLAETGPVLLSGDVAHFHAQIERGNIPAFNADRADSLASMDRMEDIATGLNAQLIVQHDPDDIGKLPAFPASAK